MLNTGNLEPLRQENSVTFAWNFKKATEPAAANQPPAQLHDGGVLAAVEVQLAQETLLDIVEHVAVDGVGRTLALQLEHYHAAVVA